MTTIAPHFKIAFGAAANPNSVVEVGKARFSILADRMIRMEYSPDAAFEDRASQAFWFREQPVPQFSVDRQSEEVVIETASLRLHYVPEQPFSAETLWIDLKEMGTTWHYGDSDPYNLGGTARTLDGVDGPTPISLGLVSRSGWSLVDDSASLVFNDDCWLEPRNAAEGQLDLYFLGYGHRYLDCLRDFNRVAGSVPMIPRWVLGNWWSRYWEYTQEELMGLMEDFESHQIPLSVCIVDMDWHITQTGNACSGWTGYTWNRQLFPDPDGMLRFMHDKGLKVALNLHPAEGIHPHEEMYKDMCECMGMDPTEGKPVEFDITDPRYVDAYFRILHHPIEERGVDFWWMDWQQGLKSKLTGLDPLWWLNHLHFYDLGRDGQKRSFIFSRWGGLGNHRYPIGFSGDTMVTWESLAFQPYFTATASNVNYGWWSHDIGGHQAGIEDGEMYARWVQLGVFLPVLRVHCTKNAYQDRRPWVYDAETFEVIRDAMQLRHAMIPYLYSMAWRYHRDHVPPLLPMYYEHPEEEAAYACPNQYQFGSELVFAPFISPKDPDTDLSRSVVWLPKGDWYNFFTGQYYEGDSWHAVYGTLREMPLFAKAGAIVPQAPKVGKGGVSTPEHLEVYVFPGADGHFELYDDEGNTNAYLEGGYALTHMTQKWSASQTTFSIDPVEGNVSYIPAQRRFDLVFRGISQPDDLHVSINGQSVVMSADYNPNNYTLTLAGITLSPSDRLEVTLRCKDGGELANRDDSRLLTCLKLFKHFKANTVTKAAIAPHLPEIVQDPAQLGRYMPSLKDSQMRAILEVITGAGMESHATTGDPIIVVWNNHGNENVILSNAMERLYQWWRNKERFPYSNEVMPRFQAIRPKEDLGYRNRWVVQANYYGFYTIKVAHEPKSLGD